MDILNYNRKAWNHQVELKNKWTLPVNEQDIVDAQNGKYDLLLTPKKPVPVNWLGELNGKQVLCLASGGGQQVPIFAALGAIVTSFDLSDAQLQQDKETCEKFGLQVQLVQGDMADLSALQNDTFDLIFHPCSNCFSEEILPVWKECFRVLKKGGVLLSGFCNPIIYAFDAEKRDEERVLEVKYKLPYSDRDSLDETQRNKFKEENEPFCYSHSLTTQLGGQLKAGFVLQDLFEDNWGGEEAEDRYFDSFIATKSMKPH
ncbi:MAG TPA: class I SAM-dependent methyltransferase [Chitinophagales bacterium]|nr:class I SAM-dependent methyltransferase [Chitinophagales bacterium]HNL84968.1 class I SAM-dependent methyltransferase [Chitinophagales bacterium]